MGISIEKPISTDVSEILELYVVTWLATYPNEAYGISYEDIKQKTDEMRGRTASFAEALEKEKDNAQRFFVVAKDKGRIVGVCGGVEEDTVVHMASMYVLPGEQRKGVGGKLMEAFLGWANKDKTIRLHVVTYNQAAITFYEKWGFVDVGKRFTEDRFVMASGNAFPEMEMVWQESFKKIM